MSHHWSDETVFRPIELGVVDRGCRVCDRQMVVCAHRHRLLFTLDGPVRLVNRVVHCPDQGCPGHAKTFSPEAEMTLALPWWAIGWDVFCWIGHRRFARHWSVPQIREELVDGYQIILSPDAIERYIQRYQVMVAARQQDPNLLEEEYRDVDELILSIDGLQPEKGHETLYAVRELNRRRVWFAESLISSSGPQVQRLLVQARQWAQRLGKPVRLWISDKQEAFVSGIAEIFPGVPHRYCDNHFLRDLAKPMLDQDSHAKVQMRSKVRGLRAIERQILDQRRPSEPEPASVASLPSGQDVAAANDGICGALLDHGPARGAVVELEAPRLPLRPAGQDTAAWDDGTISGGLDRGPARRAVVELEAPRLPLRPAGQDTAAWDDGTMSGTFDGVAVVDAMDHLEAPQLPLGSAAQGMVAWDAGTIGGAFDGVAVVDAMHDLEAPAAAGEVQHGEARREPPASVPLSPQDFGGTSADASDVVLDYCTAVRGVLNNDQGGPLQPAGVRMADALGEIRQSIERNLEAKKGGAPSPN